MADEAEREPMNEDGKSLEERVERLERRNTWLLAVAVGMAALAVIVWKGEDLLHPEPRTVGISATTIQARGFALLDEDGQSRAVLKLLDHGPTLGFMDSEGSLRLAVGLEDDDGAITVFDATGQPRLGLGTTDKGTGLSILDADGQVVWETP